MDFKPYVPWEFCKSDCEIYEHAYHHAIPESERKLRFCEQCRAYDMHQYLRDHNQILEPGSELEKMVQEAERLREENEKLLKSGTIAFNALFLLNQNLAMNNQIKDDRCQQCSRTKDFPLPVFIKCTLCQFERWMDKGKEMYEDPETKAWAEADTPEKIISLVFKDDGLEG